MEKTTPQQVQDVLAHHPYVVLALLFGSAATGRARPHSDADVAVGADRPLRNEERMTLITDLGAATGRSIDLVDLARVGEPLLGRIVTKGTRILGDERYARLLSRHLLGAADFLPYRNRILAERRQAWIGK